MGAAGIILAGGLMSAAGQLKAGKAQEKAAQLNARIVAEESAAKIADIRRSVKYADSLNATRIAKSGVRNEGSPNMQSARLASKLERAEHRIRRQSALAQNRFYNIAESSRHAGRIGFASELVGATGRTLLASDDALLAALSDRGSA